MQEGAVPLQATGAGHQAGQAAVPVVVPVAAAVEYALHWHLLPQREQEAPEAARQWSWERSPCAAAAQAAGSFGVERVCVTEC